LLDRVQQKGDEIWRRIAEWHWTGKGIDEIVPPAFQIK